MPIKIKKLASSLLSLFSQNRKKSGLLIFVTFAFLLSSLNMGALPSPASSTPSNSYTEKVSLFLTPAHAANSVVSKTQNAVQGNDVSWTEFFKNPFRNTARSVVNFLLYLVIHACLFIIGLSIVLLETILDATMFTNIMNSDAVAESWAIIRDILNMFFILILLFSAFATIFQVEKFHIKKVILMVVIMALLVNFSFPISRFIIDSANMPMYYMLSMTTSGQIGVSILDTTELKKLLVPSGSFSKYPFDVYLMAAMFAFLYMITLLVLAVLFLIRAITLVVLVILSPVGFVAGIFPSTKSFADSWWSSLLKHAFFGPIMILMLLISLKLFEAFFTTITGQANGIIVNNAYTTNGIGNVGIMIYSLVPIIILWMGMIAAGKFGIAGSDAVMSKAKGLVDKGIQFLPLPLAIRGSQAVGRGLGMGTKALGRKFDRGLAKGTFGSGGKYLSPTAMKKAWKDRTERIDREAYGVASGAIHNRLNKIFLDQDQSNQEDLAIQQQVAVEKKKFDEIGKDTSVHLNQLEKIAEQKGQTPLTQKLALIQAMFDDNDQDELALNHYKLKDRSPVTLMNRIVEDLVETGMDEQLAMKQANELGMQSIMKGNADFGVFHMNAKTGKYEGFEDTAAGREAHADLYLSKLRTMGAPQALVRNMHRNVTFDELPSLTPGGPTVKKLSAVGDAFFRKFLDGNILNRAGEFRQDHREQILDNRSQVMAVAADLRSSGNAEDAAQADRIDMLLEKFDKMERGEKP